MQTDEPIDKPALGTPEAKSREAGSIEQSGPDSTNALGVVLEQLPARLTRDIEKALAKNSTRLWHLDGMRGYVVLSEQSSSGPEECRNVIITLIDAGEQRQGAAHKWCRSSDGNQWSPS